jgi:hypothetical protein
VSTQTDQERSFEIARSWLADGLEPQRAMRLGSKAERDSGPPRGEGHVGQGETFRRFAFTGLPAAAVQASNVSTPDCDMSEGW